MDLNNLTIFRMMGEKMSWDTQRQAILSRNISNADTPQYQAEDLVPYDFKSQNDRQAVLPMLTSNAAHITNVVDGGSPSFRSVEDHPAYETKPDHNAVSLEDQMNRMSQNNIDFQKVTNLLKAQTSLLKMALGRNGA